MRYFLEAVAVSICVALTGCFTPTQSTISFYDTDGKITKTVYASESLAKTVVDAYKDHSVIWYDNGWHISLAVTMTSTENPFPTFDVSAGKKDKATFILHKNHDINVLPSLVKNIRDSEIRFTIKDSSASILSGSSDDQTNPLNVVGKSLDTLAHPIYGWANGTSVVYTLAEEPNVGDQVVGKAVTSNDLKVCGQVTAITEKAIVVEKKVYIRSAINDKQPIPVEKVEPVSSTSTVEKPVSPASLTDAVK